MITFRIVLISLNRTDTEAMIKPKEGKVKQEKKRSGYDTVTRDNGFLGRGGAEPGGENTIIKFNQIHPSQLFSFFSWKREGFEKERVFGECKDRSS